MKSILQKFTHHEKMVNKSREQLRELQAAEVPLADPLLDHPDEDVERPHAPRPFRPIQYYADQWKRQRECQLAYVRDETVTKLQSQLEKLINLEEQLRETL